MELNKESIEKMEKSFNDSLDALAALIGSDNDLEKAMKGSSKKSSSASSSSSQSQEAEIPKNGEAFESSAESEAEEPKGKAMKKSIEDMIDDDPDAKVAVDVEPFLKSLVQAIDARLDGIEKELHKSMKKISKKASGIEAMSKAIAKANYDVMMLQKATRDTVEKIGNSAQPSRSRLMKGGDRFEEQPEGADLSKYSRSDVLSKALELGKKGELSPMDITKIEGRLNIGAPLDAKHAAILAKSLAN